MLDKAPASPGLSCPPCSDFSQTSLSQAKSGQRYHITSIGDCRFSCQQILATGLAPDCVIEVVRSGGRRPRLVACGMIRAAIGIELADAIRLRPCGPNCGCSAERNS